MSTSIIQEQINILKGETKLNKKNTSTPQITHSTVDDYDFLSKGKFYFFYYKIKGRIIYIDLLMYNRSTN